ncbi:MAG TPA: methyltransferase [Ilumatobacter sp.]|nr:methyltransferase [Ilumatobacter sp.]
MTCQATEVPQYFDPSPSVASATVTFDVVLPDVAFSLTTDRGVFSHGHVDAGTGLLLREASAPPAVGNLLDLGCGAGPVTMTLARRAPSATVWAVDVNARARELTALNAERNGITNVRVVAPDEVPADIVFAAIWSNPPIRIGKAALHSLLATWLARLEPDGSATLVVQKHLGADSLQAWLAGQGYPTERIASRQGFRILVSRRLG